MEGGFRELKKAHKKLDDKERIIETLMRKIGEKELEVEFLKKDSTLRKEDLWKLVDPEYGTTILRQCRILGISTSNYYYNIGHKDEVEKRRAEGLERVNERAHAVMEKWFEYRQWATDITYIKNDDGMLYFTAVIDLLSRKIISWRLSDTMEVGFCLDVVNEAFFKYGVPAIFNCNQGSQYTSKDFITLRKGYGIRISMDGRARCLDNIYVERIWSTLKHEWVFLKDYRTKDELEEGLGEFVRFFNDERLHEALGYQTPNEVYVAGCIPNIKGIEEQIEQEEITA